MDNNDIKNIVYTDEFENLLKDEAEKAEIMSILHMKMHEKYQKLSSFINMPVIVISSMIGFLSQLKISNYQSEILGAVSILVAILKTIDNYYDYTKKTETHRIISLQYSKISKFIQIQLLLDRNTRINAKDLLDIIIYDLQNIKDSEPIISTDIIEFFNNKYDKYKNICKPNIVNGLTEVKILRDSIINEINSINNNNSDEKNNI